MDPFGSKALKWSTVEVLAKLPHVDLLIHFPMGSIKRNVPQWLKQQGTTVLDEFLGTREWRHRSAELAGSSAPTILLDIYMSQLITAGFPEEGVAAGDLPMTAMTVKNKKNLPLYFLVLASKREVGQKIWNSITRKMPDGQRTLF
jgi:three-Cys-motif partner protein